MKTISYGSSRNILILVMALILFIALSSSLCLAQWNKVNLDSTIQYNQIIFTDNLHGYIAADSLQQIDTSGARIFITSDGGKTWKENKLAASGLLSVSAIGDSLVWVSSGGTVYYSHDGGKTWQHSIASTKYGLLTVQFVDAKNGWGCGIAYLEYGGYEGICHSSDGGLTWQSQYSDSSSSPYYFPHLEKGYFIDSLHGWVANDYNVLRTTNGGKTWTYGFTNDFMLSVYFIDTLRGWATGMVSFYRTTDGGVKWIESPGDTVMYGIASLTSVFFSDTSNGWVGDGYGRIYRTNDGGLSWQRSDSSGHGINSIFFLNKNEGWAVGNKIVLHTTNGGVTAIDEPSPRPNTFRLFQNYPNPFNPSTSIQYAIGNTANGTGRQFVTLKVYDILGEEVATLVNEEKPAGSYEIKWNAENLTSGVYFYQLKAIPLSGRQAGNYVETKKMILLR